MNIGIDYGSGDRTVLYIQPAKKGKSGRAMALHQSLIGMGKEPSFAYCLHVVETDGIVEFDDLPDLIKTEQS